MNLAISAAFSAGRIHKDMFQSVIDSGFPKKSIRKKSQTSKRQPHEISKGTFRVWRIVYKHEQFLPIYI